MRGGELVEPMVVIVDHLMNARASSAGLNRVIETIVGKTGRLNGKDVTNYLEAFKAEMLMRDIVKDRQLIGFTRVVTHEYPCKGTRNSC